MLGLLSYKPQLMVGVGLLWVWQVRRDWRALLGAGMSALGLALLSWWTLPEASVAYLRFAREVLPNLPAWQDFPIWHLHTWRGFWRLVLPPLAADGLWWLSVALGLGGWAWLQKRLVAPALRYALAVVLTLWLTPHAMIYDWALLLIPAVLLWDYLPHRHAELLPPYAAVWLASLLAGPLTYVQWQVWHGGIQVSVPVLAWAVVTLARGLAKAEERGGEGG